MGTEINKENIKEAFKLISNYCQTLEECQSCDFYEICSGIENSSFYDMYGVITRM